MYSKKSQTAFEFVIFIGASAVAVLVFLTGAFDQMKEYQDTTEHIDIKDVIIKIQSEVYLAATAENGYLRDFELPTKLQNNRDYNITMIDNETFTAYTDKSSQIGLIPRIHGDIRKGNNSIRKSEGGIYIN